jgi:hypothetical protein
MMETPKVMSSGEALAEILRIVEGIDAKLDSIIEVASSMVDQVQELAASGLGGLVSGLIGGSNGNPEHSPD